MGAIRLEMRKMEVGVDWEMGGGKAVHGERKGGGISNTRDI